MSLALEVKDLHLRYADKKVLRGLSFEINEASCHALLGPNGAGKTTCISIILQLMRADRGDVKIFGLPAASQRARFLRASTPQDTSFIDSLRTEEILRFIQRSYESQESVENIAERLQIGGFLKQPAQSLSGGQKRLLSLACALVSGAKLLLLDEPSTGLDLQARDCVWTEIKRYCQAGGSVLLTTHHMNEAESLADHVSFLRHGQILRSAPLQLLKQDFSRKQLHFRSKTLDPTPFPQLEKTGPDGYYANLTQPEALLAQVFATGADIYDLRVQESSLEELFKHLATTEGAT